MTWTRDTVLGLAPDARSRAAGEGLQGASRWSLLGTDGRALWGEIKGSGKRPYRTCVDLSGPAYKCSCPSRKFPCKHALGLMLTRAVEPARVPFEPLPPWADEWMAGRLARAAAKAEPTEGGARQAADPKARDRRRARREARIQAGLDELTTWLDDVARQGLAWLRASPNADAPWDQMAARLVDAQAPGLAARVGALGGVLHSGPGWEGRALHSIGRLVLIVEGYRRRGLLDAELRAEVRTAVGWTTSDADLEGRPGVQDIWTVLGQRVEERDRLQVQRTWLRGAATGRDALLLDFAPPGQTLSTPFPVGACFEGELVFYPGALGLRAKVRVRAHRNVDAPPPFARGVAEALEPYVDALSRVPWLDRWPLYVGDVVPEPAEHATGAAFRLVDEAGLTLPIDGRFAYPWEMLAVSGGDPLEVFGEWDGEHLVVLKFTHLDEAFATPPHASGAGLMALASEAMA